MIREPINYKNIYEGIEHYKRLGYNYIEVPWLVSKESLDVTRPPEARYFDTFMGQLVASGEQSFIEIRKDLCPGRKYQCVTPCFRDEKYDSTHHPSFLKLELILPLWKGDNEAEAVDLVLKDAYNFFRRYASYEGAPVTVKTDIGFDINMLGIEVGSYGYREYDGFRWVYGTGVAEPRLSYVRQKIEEEITRRNDELMREVEG